MYVAGSPHSHLLTYNALLSLSTLNPTTAFNSKSQTPLSPEPLNQVVQWVQKLQNKTDAHW